MNVRQILNVCVQILAMPLPWPLRRLVLNLLPGFTLARGSRLGWCILLADRVEIAAGATVGHFTLCSPIGLLRLKEMASIGRGNRIVGAQKTQLYSQENARLSALVMGEHAGITRNHLIDCSNTVEVERFALIAGWGSQFLTHSPDFAKSRQASEGIVIGQYTFVGTGSIVLKGSRIPARSIVAAGSVFSGKLADEFRIYAGNPAKAVKELSRETAFFRRPAGRMRCAWSDGDEWYGG